MHSRGARKRPESKLTSGLRECVRDLLKRRALVAHQIHFVDDGNDVLDSKQPRNVGVTQRLRLQSLCRVNQDDGSVGIGRASGHIPRVLFVPRRVGDYKMPPWGRKVAVRDINGDALFPLGAQTICNEREIELAAGSKSSLQCAVPNAKIVLSTMTRTAPWK